jgi:hypothetical protein
LLIMTKRYVTQVSRFRKFFKTKPVLQDCEQNDYEALARIEKSEITRIFNLLRQDINTPIDFGRLDGVQAKLKTFL